MEQPAEQWVRYCLGDFPMEEAYLNDMLNKQNVRGDPPNSKYLLKSSSRRELSAAVFTSENSAVNRYSNHLLKLNGRRLFAVYVDKQGK